MKKIAVLLVALEIMLFSAYAQNDVQTSIQAEGNIFTISQTLTGNDMIVIPATIWNMMAKGTKYTSENMAAKLPQQIFIQISGKDSLHCKDGIGFSCGIFDRKPAKQILPALVNNENRLTGIYVNYTERANEFFELVNEHLFPLLEGWNDDPETDLDNFNIFSLNIDLCCDDVEYEYLRISYVLTLLLFNQSEEIWEFLENKCQIKRADFPEINRSSFDNIWKLEKTGRTGLYLNAFEVVDHSTGNPWLDTTNCQYYENYSWDEKTVEFLTGSYRDAKRMLDETDLLDELIEADPGKILSEMISLWNTGKIPEKRKKR